jgi:hypothetical protein
MFSLRFVGITLAVAELLVAPMPKAQTLSANSALLRQSTQQSVLVEGHQPFHLVLEIAPDTTVRARVRPTPSYMHGTVELFWGSRHHYKLVITSPEFSQTRFVDGTQIEEHDKGDFYPRWLDDFVRMLLEPVPQRQVPKLIQQRLAGGGTFALPGRPAITMPRCLETSERPGGITDETSIARICFEATHPWYQGTLDFTRYVSFSDYASFGGQMIPRVWSNDIPENIFVTGKVILLEKLSKSDAASIHVSAATPASEQIRTALLSRDDIQKRIVRIPDFQWPAEDTEALEGYMIVYVRTDRTGRIRESYWDSSDNYKLQDAGVQLALQSTLMALLVEGQPSQIEGPLVLHFATHRSNSAGLSN